MYMRGHGLASLYTFYMYLKTVVAIAAYEFKRYLVLLHS